MWVLALNMTAIIVIYKSMIGIKDIAIELIGMGLLYMNIVRMLMNVKSFF